MRILNTIWYTSRGIPGCIGIVTVKTDYGEVKQYIGCGRGQYEDEDAKYIVENGANFYANAIHPPI